MKFSVWPSPQLPWPEVLDVARHAESTGWDGVWFADHFMPAGGDLDQPFLECWSVLAGLAGTVPRIRLGALVTGNTYRHPAVLANMATTVDHISGGRLVLGLGAGWQENEHAAYGIELGSAGDRLRRLEESCQVIRGLLHEPRTSFAGEWYRLEDAPLQPKPVQEHLPLLIGGGGERVTLRIAARYADEWNTWGTPDHFGHKRQVLAGHCEAIGRPVAEIHTSTQALVMLVDDPAEAARRRADPPGFPAIIGTAAELTEELHRYADAGADEFIVPDWNLGPADRKRALLDRFLHDVAAPLR